MIAVNELTKENIQDAKQCLSLVCEWYSLTEDELLLPIFRDDKIHQIKGFYITYMIQKKDLSYACLGKLLGRDKRTIRYSYKKYSYYVEKFLKKEYEEFLEILK